MLVVPDTRYNCRVPVLLGTNFLQALADETLTRNRALPGLWKLALQFVTASSRVASSDGKVGKVVATKSVTIPASGRTILHGFSRAASTLCISVNVINEEIRVNSIPGGLIMSPALQKLRSGITSHRIPIEVTSFSEHSVTIPAKSGWCELYQVNLISPISPKNV